MSQTPQLTQPSQSSPLPRPPQREITTGNTSDRSSRAKDSVAYPLDGGCGGNAVSFYTAKYMQSIAISVAASILFDPGKAEDSGEPESNAKHFAARVLNHVDTELSAASAADIILNCDSSVHTSKKHYHYKWDFQKYALAAAAGLSVDAEDVLDTGDSDDGLDGDDIAGGGAGDRHEIDEGSDDGCEPGA